MVNERPKECLQTLSGRYEFVDVLYNEKLNSQWVVVCSRKHTTGTDIKVSGGSFIHVLRDAVSESDRQK